MYRTPHNDISYPTKASQFAFRFGSLTSGAISYPDRCSTQVIKRLCRLVPASFHGDVQGLLNAQLASATCIVEVG